MTLIELKDIQKTFGQKEATTHALKDISLKINKGDLIAIMGTSGSGKSTLLNLIGCLDVPTSGNYLLNNKTIDSNSKKQLAQLRNGCFGFVLQDFVLVPHYTVKQNILLPLIYQKNKLLKKQYKDKLDELLKKLGLFDKKNTPVGLLSGGQKQRVAIGRALINNPEIILADEPTGSLDQKTSYEIMELLIELHQEGKTVIIITHDPKIAEYCHKIINLEDGLLHIVEHHC